MNFLTWYKKQDQQVLWGGLIVLVMIISAIVYRLNQPSQPDIAEVSEAAGFQYDLKHYGKSKVITSIIMQAKDPQSVKILDLLTESATPYDSSYNCKLRFTATNSFGGRTQAYATGYVRYKGGVVSDQSNWEITSIDIRE